MSRIPPVGPVGAYKTYQIAAPRATHWRPAGCAEFDCAHYRNGWRVRVEGLPPDILNAAKTSGRKFIELHVAEGENWLVFEAGQPCFKSSEHKLPLDKQELFIVRDGDWRGNPTGRVRQHKYPDDWREDMQETFERIADVQQRG